MWKNAPPFVICRSTSIGYQSDFEDEFERGNWVLNAGPNGGKCANKWYWGKPGANGDE